MTPLLAAYIARERKHRVTPCCASGRNMEATLRLYENNLRSKLLSKTKKAIEIRTEIAKRKALGEIKQNSNC